MLSIPPILHAKLQGSVFAGPIWEFTNKASVILDDNKLPFFPDYTDHGTKHVERVIQTQLNLIPKSAIELLSDADSAVLIGASMLHDIAMHVRESGFLALVRGETGHTPVRWFDDQQGKRPGDLPWPELWEAFESEARRFSDHVMSRIVGRHSDGEQYSFAGLQTASSRWNRYDYLIIGEFLRRHHARLAHEIAFHGFPGLSEKEFPILANSLEKLANIIGAVARSHGQPLRLSLLYLEHLHRGNLRPRGTFAVYIMALLRVADYLQLEADRAPSILLQLRDPQSPISINEWNKHGSVAHVSSSATDPNAIIVELGSDHSLRTHLQMEQLLDGLQHELDASAAVLDEVYGRATKEGYDSLRLDKKRVISNIHDPKLHAELAYVPFSAQFRADPMILPLLVEPLYGAAPHYGLRELLQNAIDAVREREVYCESHAIDVSTIEFPDQEFDIVIEFEQLEDQSWVLRIKDKGIGMTANTVRDYFLCVGASFRSSKEWSDEYLDDHGQSKVVRSGRFGIGVFASFLLGNKLTVHTRHIDDKTSMGITFEATRDAEVAELRREEMPIGTQIEIPLKKRFSTNLLKCNWYTLKQPSVVRRLIVDGRIQEEYVEITNLAPHSNQKPLPAEWRCLVPKGYEAVLWTDADGPGLSCNGIRIAEYRKSNKRMEFIDPRIEWGVESEFKMPRIAVFDPNANLPLTLTRERLRGSTLPFEAELLQDVEASFFAYILVMAPNSAGELFGGSRAMNEFKLWGKRSHINWVADRQSVAPSDPWIIPQNKELASLRIGFGQFTMEDMWEDFSGGYVWYNRGESKNAKPHHFPLHVWKKKSLLRFSQILSPGWTLVDLARQFDKILLHAILELSLSLTEKENDRMIAVENRRLHCLKYSEFDYDKTINEERLKIARLPDLTAGILEIHFKSELKKLTRKSALAKLWEKYLGNRWLPFDEHERQDVITCVRSDSCLSAHIDAWTQIRDGRA